MLEAGLDGRSRVLAPHEGYGSVLLANLHQALLRGDPSMQLLEDEDWNKPYEELSLCRRTV